MNKYDFHKIRTTYSYKKEGSKKYWEFSHPNFQKDRFDLLSQISRKISYIEKFPNEKNFELDPSNNDSLYNFGAMANFSKYFEMITEDLNLIKKILKINTQIYQKAPLKALVAEENAACAAYAVLIFKKLNFLTASVESLSDFSYYINNEKFDIILISANVYAYVLEVMVKVSKIKLVIECTTYYKGT